MPFFRFTDLEIAGIASAVPRNEVSVDSYIPRFGETTVKKFKKMTGIEKARIAGAHQTAADLGFSAADHLLNNMNIKRDRVGVLNFVSHSPDYRRPATACVLQHRLGLSKECAALDISLGCSAFVYGLQSVCSALVSSDAEYGLLIVGETVSKMTNPGDRATAMVFGDAGGAALISRKQGAIINGLLRSDGSGFRAIIAPAGGFRNRYADDQEMAWSDGNKRTLFNLHMNGNDVFNFTISDVPRAIQDFWARSETSVDDYDRYILHQANQFIHKQLARKLAIPPEKMPLSLDRYGNTSAASIPLTLSDCYQDREAGIERVLMCGFGVGLSWGVVSADIDLASVLPVVVTDDYFAEGLINGPEDMINRGSPK